MLLRGCLGGIGTIMAKKLKIGLALGGGAARAFSHIGVLAGLTKHGIPIDIVTGTSMGAIIGAMFATNPDVAAIKTRFASYFESETFAKSGFNFFKELDSHDEGLLDKRSDGGPPAQGVRVHTPAHAQDAGGLGPSGPRCTVQANQ